MVRRKKSDLASDILAQLSSRGASGDDMHIALSIRPGNKISALLEILAQLTSKSPAEHASDGIPESLFLYLVSSDERLELAASHIAEILQRGEALQQGSSLDLLVRRGVIEITG
ncbi:hypothetical protein RTM1035_14882 [Roseovarius sp. TM1035]|jgi:hypothetical protein|uniref:hypothetical protein n=1 Tax=Roseovarius sp. TM1035 TaxID=391613 RepID=UPI000155683B|nr:hypothetical protein [Roseovarius sp. TM1035]EDM33279.1 hypothetical protein RTM1035_14882 [Roseovarius sp. TM1035]